MEQPDSPPGLPLASLTFTPLPQPDRLEGALPEGSSVLVISDGSTLADRLLERFAEHKLKTVVLSPDKVENPGNAEGSAGLPVINETAYAEAFGAACNKVGYPDCIVYFQPASNQTIDHSQHEALNVAFLTARASQPYLTLGDHIGRASFITVSRLDGAMGLGSESSTDPVSAGLPGMVRTLSQEWPQVFCRAVDISPDVKDDDGVNWILAEIEDADSALIEVGITINGRQAVSTAAMSLEI